jgi:hypothetical protein
MDLGELEEKVADLEAKLKYEANPYTTYYLKIEKEKFEKQIQRIKDNYAVAVQYSARDKKYKDSTKNLNPAVDIVLHVNINGKEQKPVKGTVFRFNKNGGIEASVLKQSDDKALEQMKTEVYTTSARLEDAKNKLMMLQLDSTKNEDQRVREALQAQSSQLFLQNKLNTLEKNLKLLRRSFTPLFYVPLAKLTPRKSIARAFAEDYMGSGRSITNVEDNLTLLFELIFKNQKELTFEGKSYYFVSYSWEKKEFPPYGYQTGRGKIEVRALLKKPTSLKWLLPDFVLPVAGSTPKYGPTGSSATGPSASGTGPTALGPSASGTGPTALGASASGTGPTALGPSASGTGPTALGPSASGTGPTALGPSASGTGPTALGPSASGTGPTASGPKPASAARAAMEKDGVVKTDADFLTEILEQENIIEDVFNAVMRGGGLWEDLTNAVSTFTDYTSTAVNKTRAAGVYVGNYYKDSKGWFNEINPNESLQKAAHSYKSVFNSTASIELNNHTVFRVPA